MFLLKIDDFDPGKIADSGQCFRFMPCGENEYELISRKEYLRIKDRGNGEFELSCTKEKWNDYFYNYFDLSKDYGEYRDLCLPEDEFLEKCIDYGMGIRILKQEPFETLISFIISQRKSVKAIRTSVKRLCDIAGDTIENEYGEFKTFPSAYQISDMTEEELDSCGLGYRKAYIRTVCEQIKRGDINLEYMRDLPDEELIFELMKIKGVGIKVASCVALFAYHRLSACPMDVWMKRVINEHYKGQWPESYNEGLGVLQQYMFNYARLES